MRDSLEFEFLDRRVAVHNHVPGTLAWVREMFRPAFAAEANGHPHRSTEPISVTIEAVERAPTHDRESLGLMPCFAFDHEVVRLPAWRDGSSVVIEDESFRGRSAIETKRIGVSPIGAKHHLRGASLRLVRETMTSQLDWSRHLQLHASAVASSGRVVLFAGAKGAGKTSLLGHVAASTGAGLVSNDRVIVTRTPSGWSARGVPTIVSIRRGTIELLPRLFAPSMVAEGVQPVMFTLEELGQMPLVPFDARSSPLIVSLAQFAALVDAPLVREGPLACVALVALDDDVDSFVVRPLSPRDAARRVDAVRFGVSTEPRDATVFERVVGGRDTQIGPPQSNDLCARLVAEVACVEVVVGRGLLASDAAGRQLLEALLDVG